MSTPFTLFIAFLISASTLSSAFSFTAGTPSECDNLSISWTGGTSPHQLLIIPVFGTLRNMSIPITSFSGGQGTYALPLALPAGQQFVLTMSDATGFGTGGTTGVMSVGASKGGSCNTADPGVAFAYELNSALQQCRPFVFSGYTKAVQPVTITAVIPSGTSAVLNPLVGSDSFSWTANVAQGTSMIFFMTDALGNHGGSSDIKRVGVTGDTTCLNNLSPSSTSGTPTSATKEVDSTASHTNSSPSGSATPAHGVPISAIAGTATGALVVLAVTVTLGLFFLRKRSGSFRTGDGAFRTPSRRPQHDVDLIHDPGRGNHPTTPNAIIPFVPYRSDETHVTYYPYSRHINASSTADELPPQYSKIPERRGVEYPTPLPSHHNPSPDSAPESYKS